MDLLRDNPALTTAVVVGVGVVLVGSALSWLVRVAVLAGIVLAGLAVAGALFLIVAGVVSTMAEDYFERRKR